MNLFIKNSSSEEKNRQSVLRLLGRIKSDIRSAYVNIIHCDYTHYSSGSVLYIGVHPNPSSVHQFAYRKGEDAMTYTAHTRLLFESSNPKDKAEADRLLNLYPDSRYVRNHFTLVINNITEANLGEHIGAICNELEGDGFTLRP